MSETASRIPQWMQDHVRNYLETGGAVGHLFDATPHGGRREVQTLLLKTIGRRSGNPLILPLIYGEDGDDYIIIASNGGAPAHPIWFLNLEAAARAAIQVKDVRYRASWRIAEGAERRRLWERMVELHPPYADYEKRTDRIIPLIILRPEQEIERLQD